MAIRRIITGILMLVLGLGIGLTLRPAVEPNQTALNTSLQTVDPALQAKIDRLEAAVEGLSRPPASRQSESLTATEAHVPPEPIRGIEARPAGLDDPSPTFAATEEAIAAEREFVEHAFESLADTLHAEPLDGPWAIGQEAEITEQFENRPDSTTRLVDVRCQSTLCRIELEHEFDEALHDVAVMGLAGPTFAGSDMLSRRVESPQGEVRTELFVSRKDHRLPRISDALGG